jgi:hypothetical protein
MVAFKIFKLNKTKTEKDRNIYLNGFSNSSTSPYFQNDRNKLENGECLFPLQILQIGFMIKQCFDFY